MHQKKRGQLNRAFTPLRERKQSHPPCICRENPKKWKGKSGRHGRTRPLPLKKKKDHANSKERDRNSSLKRRKRIRSISGGGKESRSDRRTYPTNRESKRGRVKKKHQARNRGVRGKLTAVGGKERPKTWGKAARKNKEGSPECIKNQNSPEPAGFRALAIQSITKMTGARSAPKSTQNPR